METGDYFPDPDPDPDPAACLLSEAEEGN